MSKFKNYKVKVTKAKEKILIILILIYDKKNVCLNFIFLFLFSLCFGACARLSFLLKNMLYKKNSSLINSFNFNNFLEMGRFFTWWIKLRFSKIFFNSQSLTKIYNTFLQVFHSFISYFCFNAIIKNPSPIHPVKRHLLSNEKHIYRYRIFLRGVRAFSVKYIPSKILHF